jgi:glycosyltransferase involved in cell wall biosynthesis
MKIPISVFIITKNEETHIEKTLQSVKNFDEIIIVDSGSTDNTLKIAQQYNVKIYHQSWPGYAKQKQYAMRLCRHEWVLNLDGDEEITPELASKFTEILQQNKADSVRFWRNDILIGQSPSRLTKHPNNHRLYKKSKAFFNENRLAHESATVNGKEIFINLAFNHYGYDSVEKVTRKNNLYSSLKAQEKFIHKKKHSILKLLCIFPLMFLKKYLVHRYIFSGRRGFVFSIMDAYYAFLKEAKLYEQYELVRLQQKEKNND